MNSTKSIRVAGAYVTGKSHLEKNIPCQDRTFSKTLNGVTVIALADGAGSCAKSDIGAEIATQFIAEFLCSNFDAVYEKEEKSVSKIILGGIQECLNQKANEINADIKDLSSTILFVGMKNNKYLAGHIGDGLIGYFKDKEDAKILSYPYNEGEYTVFTTNTHALENFRIYKENLKDIKGFILMSDGTCDSLYDLKNKSLTGYNNKFFSLLNDHRVSIKIIEEKIKKAIKSKFLDKSINGDDCSINLLALTDSVHIASIDKVKVKVSDKPDLVLDEKEPTKTINQLQSSFNSLNISFQKIEKKVSNLKTIKGDTGPRGSKGDKGSTGSQGPPGAEGATGNVELESILQWGKNVKIWLIILSVALVGLGGILAKLLFFIN